MEISLPVEAEIELFWLETLELIIAVVMLEIVLFDILLIDRKYVDLSGHLMDSI